MQHLANALCAIGFAAIATYQWVVGTNNAWTIVIMVLACLSWLMIQAREKRSTTVIEQRPRV